MGQSSRFVNGKKFLLNIKCFVMKYYKFQSMYGFVMMSKNIEKCQQMAVVIFVMNEKHAPSNLDFTILLVSRKCNVKSSYNVKIRHVI